MSTAGVKNWQSAQIEFLGVVAERTEAHTEHLRCASLHSARSFKGQRDVVAIELFAERFEVEPFFQIGETG